jgi:2-desacetyl-2-hydroxyethyl bacteriochlorophyllide A dehydrogenase
MDDTNLAGVLVGERDIRVEARPCPVAEDHGIVVEVVACGICGSDMHMWRHTPPGLPLPMTPGHEFAGRVVVVGSNVRDIHIGARVTVNPMRCYLGVGGQPGAFANYVHVPQAVLGESVYLLPDNLSFEQGALVEPLAVALHGIKRMQVSPGSRVAIFGAGPIGLSVLAGLKAKGVTDIVVSDVSPARLRVAKTLGAAVCVDVSKDDMVQALRQRFGDSQIPFCPPASNADYAFECSGAVQAFETAIRSVRFGGTIVALASGPKVSVDPNDLLFREISIIGSYSYVDEFADAIELLASGQVALQSMVSARYPLKELRSAFDAQADAATSVKTMVMMSDR